MRAHQVVLAALMLLQPRASAFALGSVAIARPLVTPRIHLDGRQTRPARGAAARMADSVNDDDDDAAMRAEISAMRVRQIKEELEALGAAHADAFEKEDLIQRLMEARRQAPADGAPAGGAPTTEQIVEGTQMFMADPDGPAILEQMQRNPHLMQAAMDIADNGVDRSKYADDEEVMEFLRKLEQITKRGMTQEM
jgi:hypothetical protein